MVSQTGAYHKASFREPQVTNTQGTPLFHTSRKRSVAYAPDVPFSIDSNEMQLRNATNKSKLLEQPKHPTYGG